MSATQRPSTLATQGRLEASRDQGSAERYRQRQREARRRRNPAGAPHPLRYDANGFPIPQPNSSFVGRVARLLNPL